MKNVSLFIVSLLLLSCSAASFAATPSAPDNKSWLAEVRSYKHNFLVKEAEMSQAQRDAFIPIYTEMENEIYQVNRDARNFEAAVSKNLASASDADFEKASDALSNVKAKEGEIEIEYFKRFSKILSKKQLFLLKRAENRFARNMLNHNKRSHKAASK